MAKMANVLISKLAPSLHAHYANYHLNLVTGKHCMYTYPLCPAAIGLNLYDIIPPSSVLLLVASAFSFNQPHKDNVIAS